MEGEFAFAASSQEEAKVSKTGLQGNKEHREALDTHHKSRFERVGTFTNGSQRPISWAVSLFTAGHKIDKQIARIHVTYI